MPSALPSSVVPISWVGVQPVQARARTIRSPSPARRAAISIRVKAISAVAKDSTSGVLVTTMPRAWAAARSIWSVPTEKVATIRTLAGRAAKVAALKGSPAAQRMPAAPASAARRAISAPSRDQGASAVFSRAS